MAHFNPQMCEPSCCVDCAGKIILDEEKCTLCWETSGDVIRAELWRMDVPPVLVAELLAGCICDPEAGDYELRVFCRVGDGEVTFVVDEDTVPGDWDCDGVCDCSYLEGKQVAVTFAGSGVFSVLDGTYLGTVVRDEFRELCYVYLEKQAVPETGLVRSSFYYDFTTGLLGPRSYHMQFGDPLCHYHYFNGAYLGSGLFVSSRLLAGNVKVAGRLSYSNQSSVPCPVPLDLHDIRFHWRVLDA